MVIVTKRNYHNVNSDKYYKAECTCESEFYFTSKDIIREKGVSNKAYIRCPVCKRYLIVFPEFYRHKAVKEVTELEYSKILMKHSESEENIKC